MVDLVRRLHLAIQDKDKPAVMEAVTAGADMERTWGAHGTALCQAISVKSLEMVKLLVEMGADVNEPCFDGIAPLGRAIREHEADIALYLISLPVCDLNALDPVPKQRIIHFAVLEGMARVVETLVQSGRCDFTKGNGVGNTALHLAFLHQQTDIAQILARCEELRSIRNYAGYTPIHLVATLGSFEGLGILFPSPTRITESEMFPRHKPGEGQGDGKEGGGGVRAKAAGKTPQQLELDQTANYTGDTPLHIALREGHSELARRLVQLGAAVDIENNIGQTSLLLACAYAKTPLVKELLQAGAPPNVAGNLRLPEQTLLAQRARESSLTPLHVAVAQKEMEMVKVLVEFGADVNACDGRCRCPLALALMHDASEVALFLLSHPDQKPLVSLGGTTLLHAAARCTEHVTEIAQRLIAIGCSVNSRDMRSNGPLHEAVSFQNGDLACVLLEHRVNPSAPGEDSSTPLAIAARTGEVGMAKLLLMAGADLGGGAKPQGDDRSDDSDEDDPDEQNTPLREALEENEGDFARYLVESGYDLSGEKYLYREDLYANVAKAAAKAENSDSSLDSSTDSFSEDGLPDVLKVDVELFRWLREKAAQPRTLFQLGLEAVRGHFRRGDPPFHDMSGLPLPEKMIAKLFFRDDV